MRALIHPLMRAAARALFACAFACAAQAGAESAASASSVDPVQADAIGGRLVLFDQRLNELREGIWRNQDLREFYGTDLRGRHAGDDFSHFVLAAAVSARLKSLRDRAAGQSQADNAVAASQSLAEAEAALSEETARFNALQRYWFLVEAASVAKGFWLDVLAGASAPERAGSQQRVTAAESALRSIIPADTGPGAAHSAQLAELIKLYNDERQQLADGSAGRAGTARERRGPCPAAATSTSGNARPKLGATSRPLEEFYPGLATRLLITGSVTVSAEVSATGCAEELMVLRSSGVPALDAAALEWLENATLLPAEDAGHRAMAAGKQFRVRFVNNNRF